ncbi:MAG: hypothetical protein ACXWWG_00480 [Nitrospira sp.]
MKLESCNSLHFQSQGTVPPSLRQDLLIVPPNAAVEPRPEQVVLALVEAKSLDPEEGAILIALGRTLQETGFHGLAIKVPVVSQADRQASLLILESVATTLDDLIVVLVDGADLVLDVTTASALDGLVLTNLVYGDEEPAKRNTMLSTQWRTDAAQTSGLPTFVVEHLEEEMHVQTAKRLTHRLGFPLTVLPVDGIQDGRTRAVFERPTP